MKMIAEYSADINGVTAHNNHGNNLWFDGAANDSNAHDQRDMVIRNNYSYDSDKNGIKCEVTINCQIYNNFVYQNGISGGSEGGWGILANSSSFGQFYDNTVVYNAGGIRIVEANRSNAHPDQTWYNDSRDQDVYSNNILAKPGEVGLDMSGGALDECKTDGTLPLPLTHDDCYSEGYNNHFYFAAADGTPQPEGTATRFKCMTRLTTLASLNNTFCGSGQPVGDADGTNASSYLTQAQAQAIVDAKGVPLAP
jgi:hypothetical protein